MGDYEEERRISNEAIKAVIGAFFQGKVPFAQLEGLPHRPQHDDTVRPELHARVWPPVRTTVVEELAFLFNVRIPAVASAYLHTLYLITGREHLILNQYVHSIMPGYLWRAEDDKEMRMIIGGSTNYLEIYVCEPKLIPTSVVFENTRPWNSDETKRKKAVERLEGVALLQRSEQLAYTMKGLKHRHKQPWMGYDVPRVHFDDSCVWMYRKAEGPTKYQRTLNNVHKFTYESRQLHRRKIVEALETAYNRLYRPTRHMREMRQKALVLCMGLHPRLGADSPLRLLPRDVFLEYVMRPASRKMLVCC
jgi:hypothetical protein